MHTVLPLLAFLAEERAGSTWVCECSLQSPCQAWRAAGEFCSRLQHSLHWGSVSGYTAPPTFLPL